MSINHLLSKSPTNLTSQTKLPSLQSSAVLGMEHPLIIPLQGVATTALANPHEIFPVPLLDQQLLVPLAAFQPANEEPSSHISGQPDSSTSMLNSKSAVQVLSQSPQLGMSLVATKADTNPIPLITDSIYSQLLNQPLLNQSKSILNKNIPVQYTPNELLNQKDKTYGATLTEDLKLKLLELNSIKPQAQENDYATDLSKTSQKNKDVTTVSKSPSNDVTTESDSAGLSKVISSLPPGWKIVGLTHLTDNAQSSPMLETHNEMSCKVSTGQGDCTLHSPSLSHHRCGVPEVVSVDLNIPPTLSLSADVFNNILDKKRPENIVLPIDLAATSPSVKKTSMIASAKSNQDTYKRSNFCQIKIKEEEVDTTAESDMCTEVSKNNFDMVKNEWKVVGLTTSSLPQTSVTDKIVPISNTQLPFPLLFSSDVGGSTEERQNNSCSSKAATILNVPTPKLLQQSTKPLPPQMETSLTSSSNDEVRWTIVGVTMANQSNVNTTSEDVTILPSKVKKLNPEKAACTVTNSQQRPVCSSESKNAPLSSEANQKGIDSTQTEDQWKVVGITHSPYDNQVSPISPISYQIPVPFNQLQQNCPTTSISSSAANEGKLISKNSTATIPSSTCLSASSNIMNNSMPFIPPYLLNASPNQNNTLLGQQQQLLLNLVQNQLHLQLQQQQQEQRQLLMNHIQSQLAFQSQMPLVNSVNEWNLVGLLSNNPPKEDPPSNQSDMKDAKKGENAMDKPTVSNSTPKKVVSKETLVSSTTKISHPSSLSDSKKSRQSRNKDASLKFTKKNTVSHLLKLKRMKTRGEEWDGTLSLSDQEGYEVDNNMKKVKEQMALLSKSDKAIRSRPLHSYAGNRRIFSKSFTSTKDEGHQKINLRSGNQIPMNDIEVSYDKKSWSDEGNEVSTPVNGNSKVCNESPPPADTRSSARKRKLKIPRKMVADVDYQPFDSSSDSN